MIAEIALPVIDVGGVPNRVYVWMANNTTQNAIVPSDCRSRLRRWIHMPPKRITPSSASEVLGQRCKKPRSVAIAEGVP